MAARPDNPAASKVGMVLSTRLDAVDAGKAQAVNWEHRYGRSLEEPTGWIQLG